MEKITFSYNWNNKLNCNVFTTFRIENSKYEVGKTYQIYLKDKHIFDAKIIGIKKMKLEQVNEYIAGIDTGYSTDEFRDIVKKMYKNLDLNNTFFYFILLKKIK